MVSWFRSSRLFLKCRSTRVSGERSGAREEKETLLSLRCARGDREVSLQLNLHGRHINSLHIDILFAFCSRGTFGVVKRVVHRRTGEVFAAKFLPLRSSTRTRAFQERDLLSRLAHPRVACLLDFFCTKRTLVLITEMYPLILHCMSFQWGSVSQALS